MKKVRTGASCLPFIFEGAVKHPMRLNGRVVGQCWVARSFLARLRGIKAFDRLEADEALLFEESDCVHGFGMDRELDLVFVDCNWCVVKVTRLGVNRVQKCKGAYAVYEMEKGHAIESGFKVGDHLVREDAPMSGVVRDESSAPEGSYP